MKPWPAENTPRSQRTRAGESSTSFRRHRYSAEWLTPARRDPLGGEHHEVIPNHSPIKIGTLKSILRNVAAHHRITVAALAGDGVGRRRNASRGGRFLLWPLRRGRRLRGRHGSE